MKREFSRAEYGNLPTFYDESVKISCTKSTQSEKRALLSVLPLLKQGLMPKQVSKRLKVSLPTISRDTAYLVKTGQILKVSKSLPHHYVFRDGTTSLEKYSETVTPTDDIRNYWMNFRISHDLKDLNWKQSWQPNAGVINRVLYSFGATIKLVVGQDGTTLMIHPSEVKGAGSKAHLDSQNKAFAVWETLKSKSNDLKDAFISDDFTETRWEYHAVALDGVAKQVLASQGNVIGSIGKFDASKGTPEGQVFVDPQGKKGILPSQLDDFTQGLVELPRILREWRGLTMALDSVSSELRELRKENTEMARKIEELKKIPEPKDSKMYGGV